MLTLLLLAAFQCPDGTPPPCRGARPTPAPSMSVAVLTFENRSRDSGDAFLGDGLADEIASQLGIVQRLTVRSRTMVRRLPDAARLGPPALGRALGAAYLVNGSIQRAAGQLRVQVELLRAASGDQAWAQTYDRAADDLFRVQSDIAQSVSEAIAGRLRPQERTSLARVPTRNAEAFQLYLRARAVPYGSPFEVSLRAIAELEQAVRLDSTFAEAWAMLARIRLGTWWFGSDHTPANLAAGQGAAERSRRLAPDGVESHLAMGYYHYWGSRDYARALAEFNAALRQRPNDADSWSAIAAVSRRQGLWDASLEQRRRAASLDPGNSEFWFNVASTLWSMRRYAEALAATDSAGRHGLDSLRLELMSSGILYGWQGIDAGRPHFHRALAIQGRTFQPTQVNDYAWFYRGDPVFHRWVDQLERPADGRLGIYYDLHAIRYYGAGDTARAVTWLDSSRVNQEQALSTDSGLVDILLGLATNYSLLGRHADAQRESERAMRQMPVTRDDYTGGQVLIIRAWVLQRAGRLDEALDVLERAMARQTGHDLSRTMLATDPEWAKLRGNPRFERIIAGH